MLPQCSAYVLDGSYYDDNILGSDSRIDSLSSGSCDFCCGASESSDKDQRAYGNLNYSPSDPARILHRQEDKSNFVGGGRAPSHSISARSASMNSSHSIHLDEKTDEQSLLPLQNDIHLIPGPPRRRRKWGICALALHTLICVLVFNSCNRDRVKNLFLSPFVTNNTNLPSNLEWPIPPDVTLGECAQWTEDSVPVSSNGIQPPYNLITAVATFELPISSETLLFLSRGAATGTIEIQYGGDSSDVQVTVKAYHRIPEELDTVDVCVLTRGEGENGIGIFGLPWSHPRGRRTVFGFTVTVLLPQVAKDSLLSVKALETDMPLFVHEIDDLNGSVHFDSISLKTASMPIHVKSLEAEKASAVTENSAIEGEFHSSSSLKLYTTNAPVNVDVTLFNADGEDYTDLDISTANSAIESTLSLESANDSGGKFKVAARTANSPLELSFIEAPVDSVLLLDATTSLGSTTVSLHPTFEGSYTAATSFQRPSILINRDVEDPAGKGRKRQVRSSAGRGPIMSGTVRWSDGNDNKKLQGSVEVRTSFAPLTLRI